jgi:hypothetical protein
MNALAVQKQLLVAESDLNRAQLVGDVSRLAGEIRALADHTTPFSSVLSCAKLLVAGMEAVQGAKPAGRSKASWWPSLRRGAELAVGFWRSFRSRGMPSNNG